MSKQSNQTKLLLPGLGLTLGAAVALIISIIAEFNIAIALILGAGIGLIIGSVVFGFLNAKQNTQ